MNERSYIIWKSNENILSYIFPVRWNPIPAVVRIRRDNDRYELTYKSAGLMSRQEYNLPLDDKSYEHLLTKIDGRLIKKKRYMIPLSSALTAELDIFEGDLAPLMLVEVEFDSEDAANSFSPPDWFGEDVTFSGKYHNSYLSTL